MNKKSTLRELSPKQLDLEKEIDKLRSYWDSEIDEEAKRELYNQLRAVELHYLHHYGYYYPKREE